MSADPNAEILRALERLAEKVDGVEQRLGERIDGVGTQVSGLGERVDSVDVRLGEFDGRIAALDERLVSEVASLRSDVAGIVREVAGHVDDTERALRDEIAKVRADLIVSSERRADSLERQVGEAWRELASHVDTTVTASEKRVRGDLDVFKAEARDTVADARQVAREDLSAESKGVRTRLADIERRLRAIEERQPAP